MSAETIDALKAFGEEERDNALKRKDREQYQFYSGWCAALDRVSAPSQPAETRWLCVCQVEDGLVQEWVAKARAVARSKGFEVAPPTEKGADA